jgi:hypothetical protein
MRWWMWWREDPEVEEKMDKARSQLARATTLSDDLRMERRRNGFGREFQSAFAPRHRPRHH